MNKKFGIVAILLLMGAVVMVSGCTGKSEVEKVNEQAQRDLEISGETYNYYEENGTARGGCYITNNGNVTYEVIVGSIEIFDKNGNIISEESMTYVEPIKPGETVFMDRFKVAEALPNGVSARVDISGASIRER
ncbi:hypothetical protein MBMB1_0477 [Methanobacterium sp. MB1]|nr:hypothetical protein MBMB1_0477 [Methanobacterium sp. MB1]